ncbi:hypothetical protein ES703_100781 [subsurface metagenome]
MNLKTAIELLTAWQNGEQITSFDDVNTAVKLGIEAFTRIQEWRQGKVLNPDFFLPSETD